MTPAWGYQRERRAHLPVAKRSPGTALPNEVTKEWRHAGCSNSNGDRFDGADQLPAARLELGAPSAVEVSGHAKLAQCS
jgi:hypothetical protein